MVEKWELPKISLNVNNDGDVVSISFKIFQKSWDKTQTLLLDLSAADCFN